MADPRNTYVNLTAPAGGYESQLADIKRRQKMAELLAQQGSEDIKVESVNGVPTPISPFQGLAKALQRLLALKQLRRVKLFIHFQIQKGLLRLMPKAQPRSRVNSKAPRYLVCPRRKPLPQKCRCRLPRRLKLA